MAYIGKKEALFVARKMKSELVHNMAVAEGTSLTLIDTKTLLEDRVTPPSKSVDDVEQVLRLGKAWDEMITHVAEKRFVVDKAHFIHFNATIARDEALRVGDFRDAQVYIGDYTPPPAEQLDNCFTLMMKNFRDKDDIEIKASDLFLDSARNQYFFDGNKRTAQIMMNGFLMLNGHNPRSIQSDDLAEYNEKMAAFYQSNDKSAMYQFLSDTASAARYRV